MRKLLFFSIALAALSFAACSDDDATADNSNANVTDTTGTGMPDWYYTGGLLGTSYISTSTAYEQPTPAVEEQGLYASFQRGESLFEDNFMATNSGVRCGLGPIYVRSSCIHCHPGYGHGISQEDGTFNSSEIGNGYLLVIYNPETNAYVTWVAGMPQGHGVSPFKAPLDESQITIKWHEYTDAWGNQFDDGETYALRYPEVTIPDSAVYVVNRGYTIPDASYEVRLENTIGIYGTGLLDAIPEDSITAQWAKEESEGYVSINTNFFSGGDWVSKYSNTKQGDGTQYVRRYTYALSRGPLQDGPGANAIWNITNVTRSDRRYHYLDNAGTYALYSSQDPEVQADFPAYIAQAADSATHPEWFTDDVEANIYSYLTSTNLEAEMTDQNFIDLMVWHRGLAVPAARNVTNEEVLLGKELFEEIGCTYCHRPSWTTGEDVVADPNLFFENEYADILPTYPNQTIWPYTDMVQHKLYMQNDIRTGWCRTTPLWGRGLHQRCTGATYADRLHDARARTTLEAIMWHGTSTESDAYYCIKKFRALSSDERTAIVKFLDSI